MKKHAILALTLSMFSGSIVGMSPPTAVEKMLEQAQAELRQAKEQFEAMKQRVINDHQDALDQAQYQLQNISDKLSDRHNKIKSAPIWRKTAIGIEIEALENAKSLAEKMVERLQKMLSAPHLDPRMSAVTLAVKSREAALSAAEEAKVRAERAAGAMSEKASGAREQAQDMMDRFRKRW